MVEDVRRLLNAGADKVSFNSAAVANPQVIRDASDKYGAQCIVVAIDAKAAPEAMAGTSTPTAGAKNTGIDAVDWATRMAEAGAGEILLTSMDRDGTRSGFDLELTRAVSDAVPVPVIASGGVGALEHLCEGIRMGGADAVLAASIFHYGEFTVAGQDADGARASPSVKAPRRTRSAHRRRAVEAQQAAGGRRPGLPDARPRARETLFNWLGRICRLALPGRLCRQRRLRAASRGAAEVLLLERTPSWSQPATQPPAPARRQLRMRRADAIAWMARIWPAPAFDLVLLDPPFRSDLAAARCRWPGGWCRAAWSNRPGEPDLPPKAGA